MFRLYVAGNGSLIITSVRENDSAVYQCFAVNDAGETSASMLLTVFGTFRVCLFYTISVCGVCGFGLFASQHSLLAFTWNCEVLYDPICVLYVSFLCLCHLDRSLWHYVFWWAWCLSVILSSCPSISHDVPLMTASAVQCGRQHHFKLIAN